MPGPFAFVIISLFAVATKPFHNHYYATIGQKMAEFCRFLRGAPTRRPHRHRANGHSPPLRGRWDPYPPPSPQNKLPPSLFLPSQFLNFGLSEICFGTTPCPLTLILLFFCSVVEVSNQLPG